LTASAARETIGASTTGRSERPCCAAASATPVRIVTPTVPDATFVVLHRFSLCVPTAAPRGLRAAKASAAATGGSDYSAELADELDADVSVLAPGVVILPIAIYK
jgi:hypothetical protein